MARLADESDGGVLVEAWHSRNLMSFRACRPAVTVSRGFLVIGALRLRFRHQRFTRNLWTASCHQISVGVV